MNFEIPYIDDSYIYIYLEKHWSFIECSCTYHDTRALALAALKKVLSQSVHTSKVHFMKNGVCGNSKSNYRINGNIHQKHYMNLYKHSKSYDCFVSVSFPRSTQITYKSSIVRYRSNYNSNQYFSFDLNSAGLKKESLELINLIIVSLQNQHLTDQDFLIHYIYETLKYINKKNMIFLLLFYCSEETL